MSEKTTDVVIVGAGPTGLMAAALLNRCGLSTRILDKENQQSHESRAFGVHAKSMELMLNIGLANAFLEKGVIATGMQIYVDGKRIVELNFDDIGRNDTPYPFLLMVPQSDIETILIEDLQKKGIQVEHETEVVSFEQNKDQVIVQAKTKFGEELNIKCSYLIGADGAHSIVRKKLNLRFEGAPYEAGFLLADCKVNWPLDYDHMKVFLNDRSLAVYLPLRGKDICRIIAMKEASSQTELETVGTTPATLAEIQTALQKASAMPVTLSDPIWVSGYRIHHRGVNHYREGRIFVAGDAAHIHSPAGGQGMNTGLQDVANLIWKLALVKHDNFSDTLLDTYHAERWPVGNKILHFTDKLFSGMSAQTKWGSTLRNLLVPVVGQLVIKFFRKKLFKFVSQLGIRYHDNAFLHNALSENVSDYFKKNLSAGHRAPDAMITRNCDVFSLLQGYCFHVLMISKKSLSKAEIDDISLEISQLPEVMGLPLKKHFVTQSLIGENEKIIRVEIPHIYKVYGLTTAQPMALFLIRPDGYIAYSSNHFSIAQLKSFIQKR